MLLSILAALPLARAATLVVDGASGYSSISEAVADAVDGDTIEVAAGTWYDCVDLDGKSLSIVGTAGSGATTLDGGGTCTSALTSTTGAPVVVLQGLTISNHEDAGVRVDGGTYIFDDLAFVDAGSASLHLYALEVQGGAVMLTNSTVSGGDITLEASGGSLEVSDCTFDEAEISTDGADVTVARTLFQDGTPSGGVLTVTGGTLVVTDSTFSDIAGSDGSAIYASDSVITITGTAFLRNAGAGYGSGGAIYAESSTLDIHSSEFIDNSATGNGTNRAHGGAVYTDSDITVAGSTFTGNLAGDSSSKSGYGGAIYAEGNVEITDSAFSSNEATDGQGGAIDAEGDVTATRCTFADDIADDGGGIYASGDVVVTDSSFLNETIGSGNEGGAIHCLSATISGSTFDSCGGGAGYGGAVYLRRDSTVTNSEFSNGSATSGGAIYLPMSDGGGSDTAILTVSGSRFESNAGGYGGAINAPNLVVDGSSLIDNTASTGAGAQVFGTITVANSYWCGNTATRYGGAVYAYTDPSNRIDGQVTSSNTIWARNSADRGGAIYLTGSEGGMTMTNDTLVANSATSDGGGVYFAACDDYTSVFLNSIFAYTSSGDAVYGASASCSTNTTYSDWYSNSASDAGGSFTFTSGGFGNVAVDPGFASYSATGDCDTDSYGLLGTSALVDAGTAALEDVDGSRSDQGATGGPDAAWVDADSDGFLEGLDCDDSNAAVHPAALEACDGLDNDCNDLVDDSAGSTWYTDGDGDGFGDPATTTVSCAAPENGVVDGTDCDDLDPNAAPGLVESCDGNDNNCDGSVDEGLTNTYYRDADADLFGDPARTRDECDTPSGYVTDATDCDDGEDTVWPGAPETCGDAVDQDCDGDDLPCPDSGDSGDSEPQDSDSPADSAGDSDEPAPTDGDKGGCGCTSAPVDSSPVAGMIAIAAMWRRRRPA